MSAYELRPHHMLCIGFFEGKGYSTGFTGNMQTVKERLYTHDPEVKLVCHTDAVCAECPNNADGLCTSFGKVKKYDVAVLDMCGLKENDQLHWRELRSIAEEKIIYSGRLSEVCGDCQWYYICKKYSL